MQNLRQALYQWRDHEATRRGVEVFRILTNSSIDEINRMLPKNREELMAVKGVKEAKYREFGKIILELVSEYGGARTTGSAVLSKNVDETNFRRPL